MKDMATFSKTRGKTEHTINRLSMNPGLTWLIKISLQNKKGQIRYIYKLIHQCPSKDIKKITS